MTTIDDKDRDQGLTAGGAGPPDAPGDDNFLCSPLDAAPAGVHCAEPASADLRPEGQGGRPAAPPPPAVVVAEVVKKTVPITAEFVAQTDAVQTVELRARIQGVLEHVRFEEGADVKEGQVLFEIQRTQYEAALQSARAQLAKAQAELARAQEQVEVERAQAELEQRKAALAKASSTSPGSSRSPRRRRCHRWIWTTPSRRSR